MAWCGTACHSMAQHDTAWHSMAASAVLRATRCYQRAAGGHRAARRPVQRAAPGTGGGARATAESPCTPCTPCWALDCRRAGDQGPFGSPSAVPAACYPMCRWAARCSQATARRQWLNMPESSGCSSRWALLSALETSQILSLAAGFRYQGWPLRALESPQLMPQQST